MLDISSLTHAIWLDSEIIATLSIERVVNYKWAGGRATTFWLAQAGALNAAVLLWSPVNGRPEKMVIDVKSVVLGGHLFGKVQVAFTQVALACSRFILADHTTLPLLPSVSYKLANALLPK